MIGKEITSLIWPKRGLAKETLSGKVDMLEDVDGKSLWLAGGGKMGGFLLEKKVRGLMEWRGGNLSV